MVEPDHIGETSNGTPQFQEQDHQASPEKNRLVAELESLLDPIDEECSRCAGQEPQSRQQRRLQGRESDNPTQHQVRSLSESEAAHSF